MQRLLMALWACLACLGIVTTPKTGLTQPRVQEFTTETVDDRETSFGDYWIVANRPHFTQVPPRRLSLPRMENPSPWIRPGSEGLITSPARLLCANTGTRSLWLTCKQADGSRHIVPFRSRCGGTPTIASLLGGRACQRPSIISVEGRRVILPERRLVEQPPPARATLPTTPRPPVVDAPVARVEQPPTRAQAPPMVVAPRNTEWPASALLMLAIAAIIMALLVGVIVHLYHGKNTAEDEKRSAEATILAMQERARERTAQTHATLLKVRQTHETLREQVTESVAAASIGLAARFRALHGDLALVETERDQLSERVGALNAQIRRLEEENAALREQAQPTAIVGDSEEVARLKHALAEAEARLTVLTGHVEELENRKARDDSTLAETLVHLANVEDELKKERAQRQNLLTQIQDLLTQIGELRIELEAHQDRTEKLFPPKPSDPPPAAPVSDPPGRGPTAFGVLREPTPVSSAHPGRGRRSTIPGPGGAPEEEPLGKDTNLPQDGFVRFDDEGPEEPTAVRGATPDTVPNTPPAQHISGVHPKPATGS